MPLTDQQVAARIRDAVNGALGDDLERAEWAFKNRTPEQMGQQYGESGRTCQEILDGYRQRRESDKQVAAFAEQLLRDRGL